MIAIVITGANARRSYAHGQLPPPPESQTRSQPCNHYTPHKIAVIFYTPAKNQAEYDETIWAARDIEREKRLERKLKRQAKQLGYELVPIQENPAA